MLKRLELSNTNRPLDVIAHWRQNAFLLLDPPYQRWDVWGPKRQENLIRSVIQGIPIPSIIVNDRMKAEWPDDYRLAVIDGRQRMTAILAFLDSRISIPGEWVGESGRRTFEDLDIVWQRKIRSMPIAITEGVLGSLEEEKLVFELINFGGVPQGQSDL